MLVSLGDKVWLVGHNKVTTLGANLQAFIKSKTWDGYTISGTLRVVSPGIVTRVQQLGSKYLAPTWDQKAYNVSPNAWDGANFIGQTAVGPVCITFQTSWDHYGV